MMNEYGIFFIILAFKTRKMEHKKKHGVYRYTLTQIFMFSFWIFKIVNMQIFPGKKSSNARNWNGGLPQSIVGSIKAAQ